MTPDVVVDIGNSRIKWGWCGDGRVNRVSTLGDDLAEWDREIAGCGPTAWAIASVHPPRTQRLLAWITARGDTTTVLTDHRHIPIPNAVKQPGSVGLDRLCACLAARELYGPSPLLVVQVGTAVVINFVTKAGEFGGGSILPGFQLMARSLASGTAVLPEVSFDEPMTGAPGQNTTEAIRNGIYLAIAGAVSKARAFYQRADPNPRPTAATSGSLPPIGGGLGRGVDASEGENPSAGQAHTPLPSPPPQGGREPSRPPHPVVGREPVTLKVVLTGGDAHRLLNLIPPPLDLAPLLTLDGIRLAAESLP